MQLESLEFRYDLTIIDTGQPLICPIGTVEVGGTGHIVCFRMINTVADESDRSITHQEMSSANLRAMERTLEIGGSQDRPIQFLTGPANVNVSAIIVGPVVVALGVAARGHIPIDELVVGTVVSASSVRTARDPTNFTQGENIGGAVSDVTNAERTIDPK